MIGTTIGDKYAIVRELGVGGMGAVFEARHTGTGRRVALKVITGELADNAQLRARFELEARAAGAIESEHIAQVLDVGHDAARAAPYLVMELLVGEDLERALERLGPLPQDVVLRIGVQACLGLAKAHAQGIVHRDIKPGNIFLSQRDSGELCVKLLDFGIAKITAPDPLNHPPSAHAPPGSPQSGSGQPALTRIGAFLGSPRYMSPEQTMGAASLDARSDLWSLGIVLYEALTGGTPFDHLQTLTEFVAWVNTRPVAPIRERAPWVDPHVARAVERCLAIIPAERYQSAAELRAALEVFLPQGASLRGTQLVTGRGGANAAPTLASGGAPGPGLPLWQPTVPGQPAITGSYGAHPGVPNPYPSAPGLAGPTLATPAVAPPPARRGGGGNTVALLAAGLGVALIGGVATVFAVRHFAGGPTPEPSASASAPPASASGLPQPIPATPELLSIVGPWWGEGGVGYDAVQANQSVELRIREPEALAAQGYMAGDTHFTLRVLPGGDSTSFRVNARIRPAAPKGTVFDRAGSRTTCENTWSNVAGKPLRADLEGETLRVQLVRIDAPSSVFKREGNKVVRCEGVDKAPVEVLDVVLTRTSTKVTPPPRWPVDAGVKPVDAGAPFDAGVKPIDAGIPAVVDAGNPDPGGNNRPLGAFCRVDPECSTGFCAARRCSINDIGRMCSGPLQCASRHCIGGRCGH